MEIGGREWQKDKIGQKSEFQKLTNPWTTFIFLENISSLVCRVAKQQPRCQAGLIKIHLCCSATSYQTPLQCCFHLPCTDIDIYILLAYLESKLLYCWPINICLQLFSFVSSRSYWAKLLTSRPLLLVSSALLGLPKKILDRNIFLLDNFLWAVLWTVAQLAPRTISSHCLFLVSFHFCHFDERLTQCYKNLIFFLHEWKKILWFC